MGIPGAQGASTTTNLGGSIIYNGWEFRTPRIRTHFGMRPEKSADGRTTLCNIYTLTVRAHVTDDILGAASHTGSTLRDSQYLARGNIQLMRARLSKNGCRLQISGFGFDLDLNPGSTSGLFDTRWGPTTKVLEFNSIGNGVVWEVLWVVEFALAECSVLSSYSGHPGHTSPTSVLATDVSYIGFPYTSGQGGVEGLTFDINYGITESGLTTRNIRGMLSIAINRASVTGEGAFNEVIAVADQLRETIQPLVPPHFRRVRQDWHLSDDRRFLRFSIVDEELPSENAYPPGVIDIQLDHTVQASAQMLPVMAQINCHFDGQIEVVKGFPYAAVFDKVLLIMQQRIDAARVVAQNAAEDNALNPIYITDVSLRESMYGRRILSFSITYIILAEGGAGMLGNLIGRSGMFIPVNVAGVDDTTWANSLAVMNTWSQRGLAGLSFQPDQDRIVGPCEGAGGTALGDAVYPPAISEGGGSLTTPCPSEGRDYVFWDNEIQVETRNGNITHSPMKAVGATATSIASIATTDGATVSPGYRSPGSDAASNRSSSTSAGSVVTFVLVGRAIRLGKKPEIPQVNIEKFHDLSDQGRLSAGDSQVTNKRGGKLGACPVFAATWRIPYTLNSLHSAVDIQSVIEDMTEALTKTTSDPSGAKVGGADEEQ